MIYAKEISGTITHTERIYEPSGNGINFWTRFVIKQFAPVDTSTGKPKGKDQEYEVKFYRKNREDITKYNLAPGKVVKCDLGLFGQSYSTDKGLAWSLNLTVMKIHNVS